METKKCIKCKEIKPRSEFYLRNKNRNWISAECKFCSKRTRRLNKEKKLGRKMHNGWPLWSKKEISEMLILYKKGISIKGISKILNRTTRGISTKLWELSKSSRLRKISFYEKDYVLNNFYKRSLSDIACKLNRTEKSIIHIATSLGLIYRKTTKIENEIELLLHSYNYETQKKLGNFWVDFLVEDFIVIEVQGSYWHCDPKIFKKPINKIQENNIDRDTRKAKYLIDKGFFLINIWEYDIKNEFEKVIQELNVLLNGNIGLNRAKSVELLRDKDNTEVTRKQLVL